VGLGETIAVRLERETLTGTFLDLEADGALRLGLSDGTERRIAAGDVYLPATRTE
jgi:BirA family biotin operon repressor/biotin-[acetyl-CoA-carboxylase] ligase